MNDQSFIVLRIAANGKPVTIATDSPLRALQIDVDTQGPDGKREVSLHFELNLDGKIGWTGQTPDIKQPR